MALIVPEESQRPYRFGMTLVCIGALFNWLGLADHHTKPVPAVRYIGVGLVASGAVLICMAMCFWMNSVRDDEDDVSREYLYNNIMRLLERDQKFFSKIHFFIIDRYNVHKTLCRVCTRRNPSEGG